MPRNVTVSRCPVPDMESGHTVDGGNTPREESMSRFHLIAVICCGATAFAPAALKGSALSALVNADFVTNGATATCAETSGGGLGTVNAPLTGCLQTFGTSLFQSKGSANAAFGTLRVLGSINYTNLSIPSGDFEFEWLLRAEADMQDRLTIPTGSFLDVTVSFTGTESNAGAIFLIDGASVPYSFPGPNTFRIPFRAGIPFEFDEGLRVDLEGSLTLDQPQGRSFSQFVDLTHTVRIVSTQVLDSQGNPISGATISSESGFDYNDPLGSSTAVPEPGSVSFLALGIGLMSLAMFRRHR
jgi:hypothetical protein